MQPFVEILSALERKFATDTNVIATIHREIVSVDRWVRDTLSDIAERDGDPGYEEPDYDSGDYDHSAGSAAAVERSIFDDIDL